MHLVVMLIILEIIKFKDHSKCIGRAKSHEKYVKLTAF